MPEAPVLSNTQRREAYEKALHLRRLRAMMKAHLAQEGFTSINGKTQFEYAWDESEVQGMKVYDLLTALPGVGKQKATAMLDTAGIPAKNTVRACGPRQRERLFDLLR